MKQIIILLYAIIMLNFSADAQEESKMLQPTPLPQIHFGKFDKFKKTNCVKNTADTKSCTYTFDATDGNEPKLSFRGFEFTWNSTNDKGQKIENVKYIGTTTFKNGDEVQGELIMGKDTEIINPLIRLYQAKDKSFISYGNTREDVRHGFTNGDVLEYRSKQLWKPAELIYWFANGDKLATQYFENNVPKNGSGDFTPKGKAVISGNYTIIKPGLIEFISFKKDFTKQFSFIDLNKCIAGNCSDGFGKKQYDSGNIFEGEFKNGEPSKGKLSYKNGGVYDGEFINGDRSGMGKLTANNGNVYEGEFMNGVRHGEGKLSGKDDKGRVFTYVGHFTYDEFYAQKAVLTYADGEKYEGGFVKGKFEGQGVLTAKDYLKTYTYTGTFKEGGFFGTGIQTYTDGTVYKSDKWIKTNGFTAGFKTEGGKTVYGKRSDDFFIEEIQPAVADEMTARLRNSFGLGPANTQKVKVNQKTYVFQSTCSSGKNRFTVISRISANPAKHAFEEVQQLALKAIGQNAWRIQSDLKYLGYAEDVKLSGIPGRDYSVSEQSINDF